MSEQATGAAFPVGTRVKYRARLVNLRGWEWGADGVGVVQDNSMGWDGKHVLVRWGDREPEWEEVANLEAATPPEPPRAPERVLAPGIVQSDDTCDGRPRLAGTRMPTDTARSRPDFEAYHRAYPHIRQEQYERAACFEAGVRWAKERRKAKRKEGTRG